MSFDYLCINQIQLFQDITRENYLKRIFLVKKKV